MNKFFSWVFQPVGRKVSFLSATMLTFLLVVILYSIIRISDIRLEMQEIAEIDIPLTEAVAEIEILQLELHLLMEKIYLKQINDADKVVLTSELLLARFQQVNINLDNHLTKANDVLDSALENRIIVDNLEQHKKTQLDLHALQRSHIQFNQFVTEILSTVLNESLSPKKWVLLEKSFRELDSKTDALLKQVELLLIDVADKTKQHTEHFFWVMVCLGLSAIIVGSYITFYTVRFIHKKFASIHKQISSAKSVLEHGLTTSNQSLQEDEFDTLSREIQSLIDVYSGEITSRQTVERELLKLVMTDPLTGAFNRHKWQEVIALELSMIARQNTFSIIHLDLDRFKSINDTYDHGIGDLVLQHAVKTIQQQIRQSDALFRMGGEEFVVLLRKASIEQARQVAEKIRIALEQYQFENLPNFTASLGVTQCQVQDTEESLLARADLALYEAKNTGRNKVVIAAAESSQAQAAVG